MRNPRPLYILLPILCTSELLAQTVTINPTIQRFIGTVSELDRSKYFTLHSGTTSDAELNQFYSDYDVTPTRQFWGPHTHAANQTGVVGQYLPDITGSSTGVRPITPNRVQTEHPRNVARYNLDENAAADWVVEYYKDYVSGPLPEFYEPMNEPFVHADEAIYGAPNATLMREKMADWFGAIGQKVNQTPELNNMQIVGYGSAWPNFEMDFGGAYFSHWNTRMKMFMDRAGAHMDAFSVHIYDGINVNQNGGRRSGSNSEAILDMIEAYSHIKWGVVKPHAITETGGIASGYPAGWNDIEAVQSVMSSNNMIFNYMNRADRIAITIPFITDKSTWHLTAENNYEPYGAVLLRPENVEQGPPNGNWVYTPKVTFYELWRNVKGKRVDIQSSHPDVQTQAFVDGNKLYVALNNLDAISHSVTLDFASSVSGLQNVRTKSLKIYPNSPHSMTDSTQSSAPASITLIPNETVVLEYTYQSAIGFNNAIRTQSYYTNKYLQYITANTTQSYTFNGVQTGTGVATLKMSIGRPQTKSKQPVVLVNGNAVNVPINWKGDDQTSRGSLFFGTIDIPVPMSLIQSNNTVSVTFPDSDGAVSSMILEVARYDAPVSAGNALGSTMSGALFDAESHPSDANTVRSIGNEVGYIKGGSWVRYDAFDFGNGASSVDVSAASATTGGSIEFRLGAATGPLVGVVDVSGTGGWSTYQTFSTNLNASGVHDLYLVFADSNAINTYLYNVQSFTFNAGSEVGITFSGALFDGESHPSDSYRVRSMTNEVGYIKGDTWIRYDAFNFGSGAGSVEVSASSGTSGGRIELRLTSPQGPLIGTVHVSGTGGWGSYENFSVNLNSAATGAHDLYMVFVDSNNTNNYLFNVQSFTFNTGAVATSWAAPLTAQPSIRNHIRPVRIWSGLPAPKLVTSRVAPGFATAHSTSAMARAPSLCPHPVH